MKKKISSIGGGPIQFYIILSIAAFIIALGGILMIDDLVLGIEICIFALALCGTGLIIMMCTHYLDYIIVTEEGIKSKKQFYSWNDLCITVGYSGPGEHIRNTYVYQFYFGTEFLRDKEQIKSCKKQGLFMDINKKRLNLILQYYKKSISIIKELPIRKLLIRKDLLLQMMKEHNKKLSIELPKTDNDKESNHNHQ